MYNFFFTYKLYRSISSIILSSIWKQKIVNKKSVCYIVYYSIQ